MGAPFRTWVARALAILLTMTVVVVDLSVAIPMWWRLVAIATFIALAVAAAYRLVPAFDPFRRVRWRIPAAPGAPRRCAITFDDGPTAATTQVLDILAAERVTATFFVLGHHVERHADVVRRAQADGHAIGVHGMDHRRLAGAGEAEVAAQVVGATLALRAAGVRAAPIYRTPHGWKSPGVFAAARRHGLTVWAWTRGVWDTDRPAPNVLVRRATRMAKSGMVLLLHDGLGDDPQPDVTAMVAALPHILRELKRRGFTFVRLADV